jgi:hypothetical protein
MKFLLPLRRGLRSAWQHPKLVLLTYLATLIPAALVGFGIFSRLAATLDDSLYARQALSGHRYGVWGDFLRGNPGDLSAVQAMLPLVAVAVLVLHVLLAAGIVESLLERERARERPFLLGIGRHGWRFLRSAIWFGLSLVVLAAILGAAMGALDDYATEAADGSLQYFGFLGIALVGLLLLIPLDLGYDLSRIAAATHDEGRTFLGYFKALGHALRHPLMLAPLWLFFSLLVAGLHISYVAARASWSPADLGQILGLLAVQQLVFLVAAFLRVGLWGGEVAYYQAVGEPRWCGRKERPSSLTAPAQPAEERTPEPKPEPEVRVEPAAAIDLTTSLQRPTEPLTPPPDLERSVREEPTETLRRPPAAGWADADLDDDGDEEAGAVDDETGGGPDRF